MTTDNEQVEPRFYEGSGYNYWKAVKNECDRIKWFGERSKPKPCATCGHWVQHIEGVGLCKPSNNDIM